MRDPGRKIEDFEGVIERKLDGPCGFLAANKNQKRKSRMRHRQRKNRNQTEWDDV